MGNAMPELFVDPLWAREARAAAAATAAKRSEDVPLVPGLVSSQESQLVWAAGERKQWLAQAGKLYSGFGRRALAADGWPAVVQEYVDGKHTYAPTQGYLFGNAPEELVRPLLAEWDPKFHGRGALPCLQVLLARFGLDAYRIVVPHAKADAYDNGPVLMPVLNVEVARLMADWLVRLRSAQRLARDWFSRHGVAVVPLLTPDALGKVRVPREKATAALVLIASEVGADRVVAAARCHGDDAAAGVARLLAADAPPELESGPAERPVRPVKVAWLERNRLPRLLFRDGTPVPDDGVANLIGALTLSNSYYYSGRGNLYDGLPEALEHCDPTALAEFGWALFEQWRAAGSPPRSGWVADQFCWLADDESAGKLAAFILNSQGTDMAKRATKALSNIDTDTALRLIQRISQRAKAHGVRSTAQNCLASAAHRLGLTPDGLADRLVPDLGLDAAGTLVLDYGPRRFTVGFDETLTPFVIDDAGKPRKNLPKPAAKDDPVLAPTAYQRFTDLKKQVRTIASDQIRRLERAMASEREWSPADFERYVLTPPLLRHLARRLVWTTGELSFRVAEDLTLADLEDGAVTLPEAARIRVAHPLDLGAAIKNWGDVFADYEITQPFSQLDRPVYELTPEERTTGRLRRFEGITVPAGALLGLVDRGWKRGHASDGGLQREMTRRVTGGPDLVLEMDPGLIAGVAYASDEQRLVRIAFDILPRDAIGPIQISELLADLAGLVR
ncbi:DUF4132 domain-containing protein [Nocardia sp. NBC_00511]|uniref:DUF4132 domain-containing protein n=1 Tax=Nocardia sp. NBC_00511 TaxID=2903591 RepID=UPI0030E27E83